MPFLLWAAFRFGQREVATAIALLSSIAVWGTLGGHGPFVQTTQDESLVLLAGLHERDGRDGRRARDRGDAAEAGRVAASRARDHRSADLDSRTTAADRSPQNRDRAVEPHEAAVRGALHRHERVEEDQRETGHLVGSRALCRVAETLRRSCRTIDTRRGLAETSSPSCCPRPPTKAARSC